MALEFTFSSVGFGTYFGLIFVFLKSRPTSEVPRGIIIPPLILLNLWRILSSCVKSKLESSVNDNSLPAKDSAPLGETAVAVPLTSLIAYPGLLSIKCSPGYKRIVVFSTISLSSPLKNENIADFRSAL